jgi:hypothetical protein
LILNTGTSRARVHHNVPQKPAKIQNKKRPVELHDRNGARTTPLLKASAFSGATQGRASAPVVHIVLDGVPVGDKRVDARLVVHRPVNGEFGGAANTVASPVRNVKSRFIVDLQQDAAPCQKTTAVFSMA